MDWTKISPANVDRIKVDDNIFLEVQEMSVTPYFSVYNDYRFILKPICDGFDEFGKVEAFIKCVNFLRNDKSISEINLSINGNANHYLENYLLDWDRLDCEIEIIIKEYKNGKT